MEIIYVLQGNILVNCSKDEYFLSPGDLILFHPQTLHSVYATSKDHVRYDVIKFDINTLKTNSSYTPKFGAIFRNAEVDPRAPVFLPADFIKHLELERIFKSCIAEIAQQDYGYDIKLQSLVASLLIEILRIWRFLGFDTSNSSAAPDETDSLHTILQYIDEHSQEPLKVQDLAEKCHMSYYYFARKFRNLYGQSCKDYLEFIRISKAKDLLIFTDFDLNYISQETGFSDCSHFIRIFKRNTGTTPKRFRENHKQKTGSV